MKAVEPVSVQAEETIRTNYFGTLQVCQALFPLLRYDAQVVHICSVAGFLLKIPSLGLQSKLGDPNLSVNDLNKILNQYVSDAKVGKNIENGWGNSSYQVSKVGLCALTIVQQKVFNRETKNRNISVNSVHPGYVRTDMTNHQGILSIEEGAIAPLFLALGHHSFKGQFIWNDCTILDWYGPPRHDP
ncbi:hypothetical protein FQA39_LY13411 [Lamprigera yunnana]|nr:hypothetical protein FQA39_LY13411 [Lamprigera yunnana]